MCVCVWFLMCTSRAVCTIVGAAAAALFYCFLLTNILFFQSLPLPRSSCSPIGRPNVNKTQMERTREIERWNLLCIGVCVSAQDRTLSRNERKKQRKKNKSIDSFIWIHWTQAMPSQAKPSQTVLNCILHLHKAFTSSSSSRIYYKRMLFDVIGMYDSFYSKIRTGKK